jgi:hypothetical protein
MQDCFLSLLFQHYGVLYGGANQAVLEMLEIQNGGDADVYGQSQR